MTTYKQMIRKLREIRRRRQQQPGNLTIPNSKKRKWNHRRRTPDGRRR